MQHHAARYPVCCLVGCAPIGRRVLRAPAPHVGPRQHWPAQLCPPPWLPAPCTALCSLRCSVMPQLCPRYALPAPPARRPGSLLPGLPSYVPVLCSRRPPPSPAPWRPAPCAALACPGIPSFMPPRPAQVLRSSGLPCSVLPQLCAPGAALPTALAPSAVRCKSGTACNAQHRKAHRVQGEVPRGRHARGRDPRRPGPWPRRQPGKSRAGPSQHHQVPCGPAASPAILVSGSRLLKFTPHAP